MESKIVNEVQFLRMIRDKKIRKEDEIWARHIKTKSVKKIKDKGTLDLNTDMTYPDVIKYEFEIISEKEDEIKER